MRNAITRFLKDESGATLVEYGLLVSLISIACVAMLSSIGTNLNTMFTSVRNCVDASSAGTSCP